MSFLFIFFFSIITKSTNSLCNSSEFYSCTCCDPIVHHCVHNAANIFSYISSCSIFKIFNPTCKLDTSTYCCVPKDSVGMKIKKDNITLFHKYCKKNVSLHDPVVNTIISSCDSISKRCYDAKNPITSEFLSMRKRPSEIKIMSLPEVTTRISTFIIVEEKNQSVTKEHMIISIWIPEDIHRFENENIKNPAIRQCQSIWFFIFISILTIN